MTLPDRIWVPGAAALLLALAFVGALLVRADGDPSLLVHAGAPCTTVRPAPPLPACDGTLAFGQGSSEVHGVHFGASGRSTGAPGSLTVQGADDAFDGQFFYRLGVSPWSTDGRVAGVQYDLPALRNARWGYGALAWAASGGDPDLVPWALIGLNVAAAAAVGAIGGGLARTAKRHAGWGLLLVLWPGFAYSLSLDTSELVASAFVLGGLLAIWHRRWIGASVLLTAALVTRDTTTVVPFAAVLAGLAAVVAAHPAFAARVPSATDATDATDGLDETSTDEVHPQTTDPAGRAGWPLAIAGAVPLVVFAGWQLLQRSRFGALPLTSSGDNNLSAPLGGLVDQLSKVLPPGGGDEAFRLVSIIGLVALLGAAGWLWWRSRATRPDTERIAWVLAVVVVVLLNAYLWSGATAFMRATTEAGLLSILLVLRWSKPRLLALAGIGLGGLWLLTAAAQLSKLG